MSEQINEAEVVEHLMDTITEDMSDEEKQMLDLIGEGAQLKDLRGLDDAHVDALYALGFNLYNQGQYDQAEAMFRYVCMMAHLNRDYWMALGNCQMMNKDYPNAINTFGFAYAMDVDDPWPCIHSARCYLGMDDKETAMSAIELAEKTIEDAEADFTDAKERIEGMKGSLN